ncbi:MAG: DNA polymerase III subunit delta [bacterium]|nr:DNA polymerase III subunit delta [bacterium]
MAKQQSYFVVGDEPLLISETVKTILAKYPNHTQEKWVKQELDSIATLVESGSLFSSQYILLAKDPAFLTKAPTDKEFERLKSIFETIETNGHAVVVYCPTKKPDIRKKVAAYLKKKATTTECNAFKDWEQNKLIEWAQNRLKGNGQTIEWNAAHHLAESCGNSLSMLAQSLDTLSTYAIGKPTITIADVQALSGDDQGTPYQLTEAIKSKNQTLALKVARLLLLNGEEPVKLCGLMASSVRLYLQMLLLQKEGKTAQNMAKSLGKNPYFIQKLLPDVKRHHTIPALKIALKTLADTDYNLKTGRLKPEDAMILALSKIMGKS